MTINDIERVWLTDTAVHIRTKDGREASEEFNRYPRLKWATGKERADFRQEHYGIHWPAIDEDLSYEGFFIKKTGSRLYDIFTAHPEINATGVARRLGMPVNLFAKYISGEKDPSHECEAAILDELGRVGSELQALAR